jgi:HAD superfamily hydrolase (TIGR01549 family)
MSLSWIFIDIGNVILIDERFQIVYYEEILRGLGPKSADISFTDLMARRENLVRAELDGIPHRTIGKDLLGEDGYAAAQERVRNRVQGTDFLTHQHVIDGAAEVLRLLSESFRLATAANQPPRVNAELENLGLLSYFELAGISADLGLSKPDPLFFQTLLKMASCEPDDAVMVGDRIDNDIAPAHRLGIKTVFVDLSPEAQGLVPRSENDRLYVDSLHRAPSRGIGRGNESIAPDARVTRITDLPSALSGIAAA